MTKQEIIFMTEYIKNVLYFATTRPGKHLRNTPGAHYFSIDDELVYENYYSDFGPLNLGCVYRYCNILNEKLKKHLNKQAVVHYTSIDPRKKANAAFLIGCYGILYLNFSPRDAWKPLQKNGQIYRPFQDATQSNSIYTISILDCLHALKRARQLGLVNFQDFDYEEYEKWNKVQAGDLNWIVPDKFIAFIGPVKLSSSIYHPPEHYLQYFKQQDIKAVIRLNKRMYDSEVFTGAGIQHYDLYFPDGSCPPRHILFKFLQISEETKGALAVHCKAGLGRTGSLIGAYLIKHYRMTARESIGWMRICRPGSVIGQQQAWLEQLEPWLTKQGNIYRKRLYNDVDALPKHEFGVYSISEKALRRNPVIPSNLSMTPQSSNITDSSTLPDIINEKPSNLKQFTTKSKGGSGEPRPQSPQQGTSTRNVSNFSDRLISSRKLRSSTTNQNTESQIGYSLNNLKENLKTAIKVTSQYDSKTSKTDHSYSNSGHRANNVIPPSPFTSVFKSTPAPPALYVKRNLGRSPSPSPTRHQPRTLPVTPSAASKNSKPNISTSLKEALCRLKLPMPRDHSLGSASVDASRCAPAAAVYHASARSDERSMATQGDMLNSIKFKRSILESMKKM